MNVKHIFVNIKNYEILDFSQNQLNNFIRIITFIDAWYPPLVYNNSLNQVCGSFIKIVEKLCKEYGYKYLYIKL